jgi:hypothetical protein
MGEVTEINTRILEETKNYEDAKLEGLFDAKEFSIALSNLIANKNIKTKEIVEFSNISKSYLNDLKDCSKNLRPKRIKLLDLCLALRATKDETNNLLRLAQYQPLDSRGDEIDRIIIWGLAHNMSNLDIRYKLIDNNHEEFQFKERDVDE